ncbi:protein arginine methyltransferase NDUFAF7, mitochondrial-like [Montipora foliosa]|uniref:protein arginine methyltransferase NDUFAF7, mitochondrial-like n=1 Tax=Montipora foliosa TaxID=591990 RepID=UPI0035F1834D
MEVARLVYVYCYMRRRVGFEEDIEASQETIKSLRTTQKIVVQTFGPVTQKFFLQQMGIDLRMNVLLKKAKPSEAEALKRGFTMLTSPSEMGNKFKVFSLVQLGLPEPAAFR